MTQQLRTRRFETRLDPTTDDLISQAADALGESRSSFVVRAAREAAERAVRPAATQSAREALDVLLANLSETDLAACPLLKGLRG
jgi:uncharacterized protein (DUF1778 family)